MSDMNCLIDHQGAPCTCHMNCIGSAYAKSWAEDRKARDNEAALMAVIAKVEKERDEARRELEFARTQINEMVKLEAKDLERNRAMESELLLLRSLAKAVEDVAYSIAGTVGTKTNAELPEWFRLRLVDLNNSLNAYRAAYPRTKKGT
jgi:hypothetical protein